MNENTAPSKKIKIKVFFKSLLSLIATCTFPTLLFLMLCFEMLLKNWKGTVISLLMLGYWISKNRLIIVEANSLIRKKLKLQATNSIWYESIGRDAITKEIQRHSQLGVYYCVLNNLMEFPDKIQWHAISNELKKLGCNVQFGSELFEVSWSPDLQMIETGQ